MFSASDQFITQMKLRELRAQRDQSLAAYARLDREVAATRGDSEHIRVLYDGLHRLRFAKQPLHPDVANLELILHDVAIGRASAETTAFWRAHLEQELAQGRLRAEIVYIFGALLEEWTKDDAADARPDPAQREVEVELLQRTSQPAVTGAYTELLDPLFAATGLAGDEVAQHVRKTVQETVYARVQPSDLKGVLMRIRGDVYRTAAVRSQAQRFLFNSTLLKELADALSILLDHLDEWDWPQDGVPAHAQWARTKWRLFLEEDLPTACLLELLGTRWQQVFDTILGQAQAQRLLRLRRLIELGAPEIILQNEQRLLEQASGRYLVSGVDLWAETAAAVAELDPGAPLDEQVKYWGEYGSIFEQRAGIMGRLGDFERFDSYDDEEQEGGMDAALTLINAETTLARTAFPTQPFYVIKADLKSYYPSIPHEVVLHMLARLGLAQTDLEFFRRYLRVPIARDESSETPIATKVGVPNHRRLSDMLGELLLRLLDIHVQRSAKVLVVRMVDDICLLAASREEALKAWQEVQRFCAACGLALNEEKCGAVCIGGDLSLGLPVTPPSWLLLTLDGEGRWSVNGPLFEAYLNQLREQIAATPSILARVELYNSAIRYLQQAFAIAAPLGKTHRQSVRNAIMRVHYAFFGDERGILDAVRDLIRERYLGAASATYLPEAWVYWPITAGGLGLTQAVMLAASYGEGYAKRKPIAPPSERSGDWQRRRNDWASFYASLLGDVGPVEPAPNKVMETLVSDFISRGAELTEGRQTSLSTYWRWVLYIYGPQLLQHFGTFRFLFSELVPLQLLTQRGRLDTGTPGGDADTMMEE